MATIGGNDERATTAACGATGLKTCEHPNCNKTFKPFNGKKFHSPACKRNYEELLRERGKQALKRGKLHAALLENSPDRLQPVAIFLSDGKPHSTREIIMACDVCAVNTIADELRAPKNGFDIDCKQVSKNRWEYKMVGGFEQILRIV